MIDQGAIEFDEHAQGSKSDTSDGGTQDHLVSLGVGVCLGAGLFSGQRDRYVCGSRGQFHDLAVGCEFRQGLLLQSPPYTEEARETH